MAHPATRQAFTTRQGPLSAAEPWVRDLGTEEEVPPLRATGGVSAARGVVHALPIVNVAFCAHYNAPRYYAELKGRTLPKFAACVAVSYLVCGLVYASTALLGYATFGEKTQPNYLEDFSESDAPATVAQQQQDRVFLARPERYAFQSSISEPAI